MERSYRLQTLSDELRRLGVQTGDLLMLHGSLRKLGLARSQGVADGATLILDAIDEVLGPQGTLLMVLGTDYPLDWVNLRPVSERAALLAGTPPFDYLNAAVLPEVGHLAEAFRVRPGTVVSHNPSGRFGARGKLALPLLKDAPWDDYYGPGSPLDRLCALNGRVLRLGANLETITVLHYAEYLANVSKKRRTRWDYVLEVEGAPRHVWMECLNDAEGIAPWSGDDYFAQIMREYFAIGQHLQGRVGNADCELLDATELVQFGTRWMEEHLDHP